MGTPRLTAGARLAGVAAALLAAWAGPIRAAQPPPPRVLLVSIDSLRADHLPFHGYPRQTAPFLQGLARRPGATLYLRATAVSPSCHPSHVTLLTGLYPQQVGTLACGEDLLVRHGDLQDEDDQAALHALQAELRRKPRPLVRQRVSAVMNWLKIPRRTRLVAPFLQERGFQTAAFVSIWTLEARFGYGRGFDLYADELSEYYGPRSLSWLLRDRLGSQRRTPAAETVERAIAALDDLDPERPFFLFLHLADTHVPYATGGAGFDGEVPEIREAVEAARRQRYAPGAWEAARRRLGPQEDSLLDRYDASILATDGQLGRFLAALQERGLHEGLAVIVTSDHGDSFGQHRRLSGLRQGRPFLEHSLYVWEETQHVPLLVIDPRRSGPARVEEANVSHVDILPTLLALVGIPPQDLGAGPLPGQDVSTPALQQRPAFFMTFGRGRPGILKDFAMDYPEFIGYRLGDLKFFVDKARFKAPREGRCFLYDLALDPDERDNLCPEAGSAAAARHRQILVDWYDRTLATRSRQEIPRARREQRREP